MTGFALAMLVALLVDAVFGWPDALYRRIGHPVTWLGHLISRCDRRLNVPGNVLGRVAAGALTVAICVGATLAVALGLNSMLPSGVTGAVLAGVLAWPLVAARSMHDHVTAVAAPLESGEVIGARAAVSMIVGRETATLDAAGVGRAAIESLAENSSDGVVAPLFWGALFGLPGIAAYKAINTLDSMIGHRTARHEEFGRVAAKLDDLVNLIPARLTALLFALVSPRPIASLRAMIRDGGLHRSPNAGWPEAAMAGALGIRLSGPRSYGGRTSNEPFVNAKGVDPRAATLRAALTIYVRAMIAVAGILALIALA